MFVCKLREKIRAVVCGTYFLVLVSVLFVILDSVPSVFVGPRDRLERASPKCPCFVWSEMSNLNSVSYSTMYDVTFLKKY